ncbi:xanthine dehydrogenase family protein subunit M [Plantactinospora sp. S1510]|uniref:Xanthine dehydrogenase family protein subunit M n=1 Tax=Plantactinospora alkalitolerans TaxID=2789879 RepID=A0ABS0H831_9ACTN|nr:xanthine dehydrogenase family protein subunit M [Plantactinospora alkalitolerans]MBF9134474.1 xanthine dehydrogenase family protein subunit M [Plantactinospora alkalitolerans]
MRAFDFAVAETLGQALTRAGSGAGSAYLAGGTTLVDLMKLDVMTPRQVVDINRLPLRGVTTDRSGLHIGALERMSDVAVHPLVTARYPVIAQALSRSASPQLRNMASIGGNLLQRVRCGYFRDTSTPCNKREPGSGCPAIGGENRGHAILGTSDSCVATHPSDLAVALVALDASVRLVGRDGTRDVRLADFYRLPGDTPQLEHDLRPGELVTRVTVPELAWARRSAYLKIRDRQSYEFALASAAVALDLRDGVIRDVRLAVGGVGTRPWRLPEVEEALRGMSPRPDAVEAAAARAVADARPLAHNRFKVTLVRRTIVRALTNLAG